MMDLIDAQIYSFFGYSPPSFFLHCENSLLTNIDLCVLKEVRETYVILEIKQSCLLPIMCDNGEEEIWAIFMNPPTSNKKCILVKRPAIYDLQLEFACERCF